MLPRIVNAYIEITPFDMIKYEIDKVSGYLRVDRPQRTSSHPPALYGFIPKTYCGTRVAKLAPGSERGDGDPLDICVVSERPIERSEVILRARVIGGIKLLDRGEADDKIIAVLEGDYIWDHVKEISQLPPVLVERLEHYFSTYKMVPGEPNKMHDLGQIRFRSRQGGHRGGARGLRREIRRGQRGSAPKLRMARTVDIPDC